jgi:hypothetical protein
VLDQVGDQVRDQVTAQVRAQVLAQVLAQVDDQVRAQVRAQVWDQVRGQVTAQVLDQVLAQVWDQVRGQVRRRVRRRVEAEACYGSQDAWLAAYLDTYARLGVHGVDSGAGLIACGDSVGWFWPFAGACIYTDRPTVINMVDGVLHSQTGPAIAYADGFAVYCWRGQQVPAEWIETPPDQLDPTIPLTWQHADQRTAAAEIIGWGRVLAQLPHRVIDTDADPQIGELVEVDLPDAPGERFLRARCGTGRDVCIPVGRDFETALDANAATYNLPAALVRAYGVRT